MRGLIVPLSVALVMLAATPAVADREFAAGRSSRGGAEVSATQEKEPSHEKEKEAGARPTKGPAGVKIPKGANELTKGSADVALENDSTRRLDVYIPECWDGMVEKAECRAAPPGAAPTDPEQPAAPRPAPPTRAQAEALVRTLVGRLDLPEPEPLVGPDPSVNEWDMAVVGYPLWLWVEGDATMSSQVSGYGITITLDARRTRTVFSMGDGKSVACARMSPYTRAVKPATPSPTCGYTYSWPSLPKGSYHVTAASSWVVDWTALGYSGSIPITVTGERDLPVGELHSLNKAP